ncbi:MAG TPA: hypothetical protein VHG32_01435 [Thermoanaerobaculia bacterium]|nr:hypothetical protein [Thermoanaerobaculia bacterium]
MSRSSSVAPRVRLALIPLAGSFVLFSLAAPAAAAASPASPSTGVPPSGASPLAAGRERPGDAPPDLTPYQRPLIAEEARRAVTQTLSPAIVDLVVAAGLGASDAFGDQETSIAVDPSNPNHITITAFSGGWGSSAPIWTSTDGGLTWAKSFTVSAPPNQPDASGCPCDQTLDYGHGSAILYGTFLGIGNSDEPTWSGDTTDPTNLASWQWLTSGGTAQDTSHTTFSDQPWLMVNRDPDLATQDDVYVGYTDYGATPPANHVAVSLGASPPSFAGNQDVVVGTSTNTGFLASGAIRIAADPNNGAVYAAWEDNVSLDLATCAKSVDFRLSRSTDHGQTWSLNGSGSGILVATHESDEGWPDDPNLPATSCHSHVEKFGTVNALLGGSEAVAVDPGEGDVYYVYHDRDSGTGNNRLQISRLTADGLGGLTVAQTSFVSGQVQAALPAVAVAANGAVAVLYDVYDGIVSGFPQFEVHLAMSTDHAATWTDQTLVTFLSPANNTANQRQRVLGDYQQLKAVGNTFYAAFPANGAAAGRSTSNIDPFFYKVAAPPVPLRFFTLTPCRIADTRNANGPLGGPVLAASGDRVFPTFSSSCGIPATARALSVNVTVVGPTALGDLRLYAGATPLPGTSTINFRAGYVRANNAVVSTGEGGLAVHLDSTGTVHFILDVNGYFE